MLSINVPQIDLTQLQKQIIKAHDAAIVEASTRALTVLRGNQPVRTGKLRSQTVAKIFRSKRTHLMGVSLQVARNSERRFVNHILEYGAKSHGGRGTNKRKIRPGAPGDRGPIVPRLVFQKTWRAIQAQVVANYTQAFLAGLSK